VKGWPNIAYLEWSPDGRFFYSGSFQGHAVLYVDLKGNALPLWQTKGGETDSSVAAIPSPDGHYIALTEKVTTRNLWMPESFGVQRFIRSANTCNLTSTRNREPTCNLTSITYSFVIVSSKFSITFATIVHAASSGALSEKFA
jgi:WD40 repeat protein